MSQPWAFSLNKQWCLINWSFHYCCFSVYSGCNPREYPTTRFINGHEYRYKRPIDVHPLKAIVTGGVLHHFIGFPLSTCVLHQNYTYRGWCRLMFYFVIDVLICVCMCVVWRLQVVPSVQRMVSAGKAPVHITNASAQRDGKDRTVWWV